MAIMNSFMLHSVIGNNVLSLTPPPGSSYLIKDVMVFNPTLEKYATLKIDRSVVGYFRTSGLLGGHLGFPVSPGNHSHDVKFTDSALATPIYQFIKDAGGVASSQMGMTTEVAAADDELLKNVVQYSQSNGAKQTVLRYLAGKGIFDGYPVATGETFTIEGVDEAGAVQVVIYEEYDEGDIVNTQDNGSASDNFMFINYGRTASAITGAGDNIINTPITPVEFPDFPYADDVPGKVEIELFGVLGSPVLDWDTATQHSFTQYLKFIVDRKVLFDEQRNGILMKGSGLADVAQSVVGEGQTLVGNYSERDYREPFLFPQPLKFGVGEELFIYHNSGIATTAASIAVALSEIGLIEKVTRIT